MPLLTSTVSVWRLISVTVTFDLYALISNQFIFASKWPLVKMSWRQIGDMFRSPITRFVRSLWVWTLSRGILKIIRSSQAINGFDLCPPTPNQVKFCLWNSLACLYIESVHVWAQVRVRTNFYEDSLEAFLGCCVHKAIMCSVWSQRPWRLTFGHLNLISSTFSQTESLCQI